MKLNRKSSCRAALTVIASVAVTQMAQGSTISNFTTITDTDYASAGYGGMRGIGTGSISLSGVSGTVTQAYLYWHGPQSVAGSNANVNFAGNSVTGTSLGLSSDNCWGFDHSEAYRADVTSFVTGDGAYSLSNFFKSGQADINGASLMVMFDDGNTANNRDIVIFDGNDSNISNPYDIDGWNVTLNGINYTSGSASLELGVSDGQTFSDDAVIVNGNTLAASGAIFSGNSVPNGPGGPTNGGLWDIKTYDVTSELSPGLNNLAMTSGAGSDCLSLVHAVINLPAGAAPPTPSVPDGGSTLALLGASALGLGSLKRRVKKA